MEITEPVVTLNPSITEQKRKEKPPVLPRPHAKCPAALSAVSWSYTCKARVCFAQTSLASLCALSLLRDGNVVLRWCLVELYYQCGHSVIDALDWNGFNNLLKM